MSELDIYEHAFPLIQLSSDPATNTGRDYLEKLEGSRNFFQVDISLNRTPLRAVLYERQYIDSRWAFVFSNNAFVRQSAYLKPDNLIKDIVGSDISKAIILDPETVYFMAYNHDYSNYYHWTLQCFPTLALYQSLKTIYPRFKLLLPVNLPDFAIQYLRLLQIDFDTEIEFVPVGKLLFAERLVYPSLLGGEFAYNSSPTMLNFISNCFERNIKARNPSSTTATKKILYCSRTDSSNRKITNEGDLIRMLQEEYGADIFVCSGKTIYDQSERFSTASIVVSPHGAGMSNLVYCNAGTTIIEMMPDKYLNPCFATLAVNKGCAYYPFAFTTKTANGHQHEYEWEIDMNVVKNTLKNLV